MDAPLYGLHHKILEADLSLYGCRRTGCGITKRVGENNTCRRPRSAGAEELRERGACEVYKVRLAKLLD